MIDNLPNIKPLTRRLWLVENMRELGITVAEAAEALDVQDETVVNWRMGNSKIADKRYAQFETYFEKVRAAK